MKVYSRVIGEFETEEFFFKLYLKRINDIILRNRCWIYISSRVIDVLIIREFSIYVLDEVSKLFLHQRINLKWNYFKGCTHMDYFVHINRIGKIFKRGILLEGTILYEGHQFSLKETRIAVWGRVIITGIRIVF